MSAHYPKATLRLAGVDGGSYIGGPPRGVFHETITTPDGFYRRNTYYHIQFMQWPLTDAPRIEQHIPFDRASRALRNLTSTQRVSAGLTPEDVQTNRMGSVNINVALVGYQVPTGNYPSLYPLTDAMLNELSEFVEWCEEEWGIPADVSALLATPGASEAGYHAPARFSNEEWRQFTGWCGHERVTENTHHDPYWMLGRQLGAWLGDTEEDDMAILTDDEQRELQAFLQELKKVDSNVTFPRFLIPWFRKWSGSIPEHFAKKGEVLPAEETVKIVRAA